MCVIFGLALLSGGIASAVYASRNSDQYETTVQFSEIFTAVSLVI